MFATSSQKSNWLFQDDTELNKLKEDVHSAYIELHSSRIPVSFTFSFSLYFLFQFQFVNINNI